MLITVEVYSLSLLEARSPKFKSTGTSCFQRLLDTALRKCPGDGTGGDGGPFLVNVPSPGGQTGAPATGRGCCRSRGFTSLGIPVPTLAEPHRHRPRPGGVSFQRLSITLLPPNLSVQSPFHPRQGSVQFFQLCRTQVPPGIPRGRWPSGLVSTLECDFPFQLETTQDGKGFWPETTSAFTRRAAGGPPA